MTGLAHQSTGWPSDDVAPPDSSEWDLLVIGGGTAGLVAAKTAAGFGATVLLVERDRTGGDCLWTGCVPSKALLAAAHGAADARAAARYGVHVETVRIDFGEVMAHVRRAITTLEPTDSPAALRAAGVHVAYGTARFTGPASADIDGREIRFRQALLATGSAPVTPPVPGLADTGPLTSDTVWGLTELPRRLLVLGGGSIGCELGQAFARLGSSVTVVEAAGRLLIREDADAARLVQAALGADGVIIHTGTALTSVTPAGGDGATAHLDDGTGISFDQVFVAAGRSPRTDGLGLDAAGVDLDDGGYVAVDTHLRTSNRRVWAAGDVTGHPQFTHVAGVHGSIAATNAVLGLRRTVDTATIPRVTFTQPEVAAVGVGSEHARAHPRLIVRTTEHVDVDRAIAEGHTAGYTRLVLDGKHRIVGASIVGPRAGESLAELVLAARHGLRARDIAAATHAYPTYADGAWKAGIADIQQQLAKPAAHAVTRVLAGLRRHLD
jgi:pyruvate/2-oxoglutarate dehydrogenase complex dihydrolipoamide dehydrogenase (E3) component